MRVWSAGSGGCRLIGTNAGLAAVARLVRQPNFDDPRLSYRAWRRGQTKSKKLRCRRFNSAMRNRLSMTLGRPLMSPGFTGCPWPELPGQRRARQRCPACGVV